MCVEGGAGEGGGGGCLSIHYLQVFFSKEIMREYETVNYRLIWPDKAGKHEDLCLPARNASENLLLECYTSYARNNRKEE